ncbi:tail fiber domain-containing protein [bacterium]|nr:tail fiber domain-containing protein [bacterium]
MSNTSNRWKSQGGINRRAMNNILSNNKQATNNLTIPQQLGISNTTIEQYGDVHDISNTVLNNTQIGGTLDITGEMKVYNKSYFKNTAYFTQGAMFDSSINTIIYDTSAVNHIDIFTTSDDTSHTASIFIQNARGVTNNDHHMPSMLVYNQQPLTNQPMSTASMENLIFSISGENVSIGEIYGQNTFDVGGNSSFLGKVGIGKSETSMVTLDSATLDVSGSVSISGQTSIHGSLDVSHNITSNASIILNQSSSSINIGELNNQIHIGNDKNVSYFDSFSEPIHFRTVQTDDNNKNTQFAIGQSGNVGIGNNNTNPQYTLDVSGTMYVSSSLDVSGVARFQDITYGKTPEDDASGQEFPTCEWINENYSAAGGWKKDPSSNGIYNSNIERDNGYVGIGTKTPEYMLDVGGDIHVITGDLILEDGDISMNKSIVAGGSITTDGSIVAGGSITTRSDITVDGSANIGFDMTIGGKVGIGLGTETIDPSFVLDISGDMYSNGNILTRGKVGIGARGTANDIGFQNGKIEPQAELDVGGSMRVSEQVNFVNGPVFGPAPTDSSEEGWGLQLVTMDWVTDAIGASGGWIAADNSIYNGNIDNEDAFVGIGTMTPTSTLDVSGNTTLRGTLDVTGESIFHSDMNISQNKITVQDISASRNLNINVAITFSDNISIQSNEVSGSIAMGNSAGEANQSDNSIAMGNSAGKANQSANSIAMGNSAGKANQSDNSIAMGNSAGQTDQGKNSIAMGNSAGQTYQGENSIAMGNSAGNNNQGENSIAIGNDAGLNNQPANSIAIGNNVNTTTEYEIRIGDDSNNVVIPGVCTMDQQSGFSSKNKINIIPIPNPLGTDYGNTSDINMWGTFTNSYFSDNSPRQTATIQSGYSNQINSKYGSEDLSKDYKGAWGGEYLSFKVGNYDSSSNMLNDSSMDKSTFSDISNVVLNNEVMRITAEGNVGIGTDSPTSTLDVIGDITATTGTIEGSNLTDGTASMTGGALTGVTGITASGALNVTGNISASGTGTGTITGSNLTDGTASMTGGALSGVTSITASGALTGVTDITASGTLDVSGVCTMNQQSGFSSKNKINIIPIPVPVPLDTDYGNTSDINMWGTFTNTGKYKFDNNPRQTATIQSGYSNQLNSKYGSEDLSKDYKGAWGGEYLSFKVGNYYSSSNMSNDSSMDKSTFSDISNVVLNNEVMRITAEGNVGIGTDSPTSTLDVSGTITATTFNAKSDMRLKENIHDLSNSLEKICAIRGVEYNWKADEEKKLHSGVIAQEVKESIPEAVNTDNEEQYSVNYNAIIGHLIEAVKTLKQEVDDLKGQLKK